MFCARSVRMAAVCRKQSISVLKTSWLHDSSVARISERKNLKNSHAQMALHCEFAVYCTDGAIKFDIGGKFEIGGKLK